MGNFTAADVKNCVTVAGVAGTATLENHAPCSLDGEAGCITTASYKAADMSQVTAANVKNGVTIAGVVGTYPSAATPLTGASATDDLVSRGDGRGKL